MNINELDELKAYRGDDYAINDKIIIRQPTVGEIVDYGEKEYFKMVQGLCSTPSDIMVELTELGVDFVGMEDFELFKTLAGTFSKKQTEILLGKLDLSSLELYDNLKNGEVLLYNEESGVKIDKLIYQKMINFIRFIHGLKANHDVPATNSARKMMIELAKQDALIAAKKPYKSNLKNLISGMINSGAFQYSLTEVFDLTIYQFMDAVQRVQVVKKADAMLHGIYGGMIDVSKLNKEELNWLRNL